MMKHAQIYYKKRQGVIFNPLTDRGKSRLQVVENLIVKTEKMLKPAPQKTIKKLPTSMMWEVFSGGQRISKNVVSGVTEALKDAKKQAEVMAQTIDQKVVRLISADKNAPKRDTDCFAEVLCMGSLSCGEVEEYDNSNELSPSSGTYTETIYTTWEIA